MGPFSPLPPIFPSSFLYLPLPFFLPSLLFVPTKKRPYDKSKSTAVCKPGRDLTRNWNQPAPWSGISSLQNWFCCLYNPAYGIFFFYGSPSWLTQNIRKKNNLEGCTDKILLLLSLHKDAKTWKKKWSLVILIFWEYFVYTTS